MECVSSDIKLNLFTRRLYLSEWACEKLRNVLFWECTRFFMLIGFIFNAVTGNIILNYLILGCFLASFCIYFQSSHGFLIRRASPLAGFCVVRVFAEGIFKQTWLKITNHLISRAYNQIILNDIGVTEL